MQQSDRNSHFEATTSKLFLGDSRVDDWASRKGSAKEVVVDRQAAREAVPQQAAHTLLMRYFREPYPALRRVVVSWSVAGEASRSLGSIIV